MTTPFRAAVLTGATSGIGRATADLLAVRADHLVLLGKESDAEAAQSLDTVRALARGRIDYVQVDFAEPDSTRAAAAAVRRLLPRIDLLINDAGMPGLPDRVVTADGSERTFAVNALGPALFTQLLMPALSQGSRVVFVASSAHRVEAFDPGDPDLSRHYSAVGAYARSKGALLAWALALADAARGSGIEVVALCPGLNDTPLSATMMGRVGGSPRVGAAHTWHAATATLPTGSYLEGDRILTPGPPAGDVRTRAVVSAVIERRIGAPQPGRSGTAA